MKILIVGADGFQRSDENQRVECISWDNLRKLGNLRDYDKLLINLLSVKKKMDIDWIKFLNCLNPRVVASILQPGGQIILLGDPRFQIQIKEENREVGQPFLSWTGLNFFWDDQPGDTISFENDWEHRQYEEYIGKLKKWKYSLHACNVDFDAYEKVLNLVEWRKSGVTLELQKDAFCTNRYFKALAFSVNLALVRSGDEYHSSEKKVIFELGKFLFLPETELGIDESIGVVLKHICGVQDIESPEPEWINGYRAPGQKKIDEGIREIKTKIGSLLTELNLKESDREKTRTCLKLLYERGVPLEQATREVLRGLGAHVEDPKETGLEDGWVTIKIKNQTFEGVIEVKSTKNTQFDENGIRQLLDWINRGVETRERKYKGIFIGSNSVDQSLGERPWAFGDKWQKTAHLHKIVAVKTEYLYFIHLLNALGKLDRDKFWKELFETNGVFEIRPYTDLLSPRENSNQNDENIEGQ